MAFYSATRQDSWIVWGLQTCVNAISVLWHGVTSVIMVAGEDFHVWVCEVGAGLGSLLLWLVQSGEQVGRSITDIVSLLGELLLGTGHSVLAIQNGVLHFSSKLSSCILNVFGWLKHMCVLLGWGIWIAVTFVPLSVVYLCINATYFVGRFVEELVLLVCSFCTGSMSAGQALYEFITDVPIESTVGLFIGACLLYVVIRTHLLLYMVVRETAGLTLEAIVNRWRRSREEEHSSGGKQSPGRNGLCVICLERGKCLLTMPCRHLCMCVECWDTLAHYHVRNNARSCPVCRRSVEYTIHVF